jgi:hypothetical protein
VRERYNLRDVVSGIIVTVRPCAVLREHGLALLVSKEVDVHCNQAAVSALHRPGLPALAVPPEA